MAGPPSARLDPFQGRGSRTKSRARLGQAAPRLLRPQAALAASAPARVGRLMSLESLVGGRLATRATRTRAAPGAATATGLEMPSAAFGCFRLLSAWESGGKCGCQLQGGSAGPKGSAGSALPPQLKTAHPEIKHEAEWRKESGLTQCNEWHLPPPGPLRPAPAAPAAPAIPRHGQRDDAAHVRPAAGAGRGRTAAECTPGAPQPASPAGPARPITEMGNGFSANSTRGWAGWADSANRRITVPAPLPSGFVPAREWLKV